MRLSLMVPNTNWLLDATFILNSGEELREYLQGHIKQ